MSIAKDFEVYILETTYFCTLYSTVQYTFVPVQMMYMGVISVVPKNISMFCPSSKKRSFDQVSFVVCGILEVIKHVKKIKTAENNVTCLNTFVIFMLLNMSKHFLFNAESFAVCTILKTVLFS